MRLVSTLSNTACFDERGRGSEMKISSHKKLNDGKADYAKMNCTTDNQAHFNCKTLQTQQQLHV